MCWVRKRGWLRPLYAGPLGVVPKGGGALILKPRMRCTRWLAISSESLSLEAQSKWEFLGLARFSALQEP